MQKEYQFAYIAGLVDGEGTITLTYNNKVDLFRAPILSMSSTSKELLVFLQKEFGGSIVRHKTYKEHHKESWSWRVQRQKALEAIESIFLIYKRRKKEEEPRFY